MPKWRDDAYLAWIRQIPCVFCHPEVIHDPWAYQDGRRRSDPDHIPSDLKAIGMKVPDHHTIPLDRECHELRHRWIRRPRIPLTVKECEDKGIPLQLAEVNLFEIIARLLWQYHWKE